MQKAAWHRRGEGAQCKARWRQNHQSRASSRDGGPSPTSRAAGVARCQLKKCTFRWKARQIVAWVRPSRVSLRSGLGVARVCGPMRRDSQAGTSERRDRRVTGPIDDERRGRKRLHVRVKSKHFASIHQSHFGVVKTPGARNARATGGNSFRAGGERGIRKESVGARRDLIENERGTGARD